MSGPPQEPAHSRGRTACVTRRRALELTGLGALSLLVPRVMAATAGPPKDVRERSLHFYNTHTGEALERVYFAEGAYLGSALAEIDYVLRDHRTNEVKPIDRRLLDLLYGLRVSLEASDAYHVISGYRSQKTNEMLRARGSGVGVQSLHLYGMAIDVSVPGRDVAFVRKAAVGLLAGGVGYYPSPGFVHLDVGRVRAW